MSTSLLYPLFGLWGYVYQAAQFWNRGIVFLLKLRRDAISCPECGYPEIIRQGTVTRRLRSVPIGKKPIWFEVEFQRVECRRCGALRLTGLGVADPKRSYTKAFARYTLELSKHMTIRDVARHLGVGWDLVKEIQKNHLERFYSRPKLKHLKWIAIDEISIGRGHRYLTVVLDLKSGVVVFVGDGKGADALKPFWKRLRASHARIQAVATDMSPAYIQAVTEHLKDAVLVFDHFHILKLFHDKLSDLRRKLHREATDLLHKKVLKGTRWLLLKNPDHLDEKHDERKRLDEALKMNQPLATAYYLKEDLRQIWSQMSKRDARRFLRDWCARAESSGIPILVKFAHTLAAHREGILAWYDYPISTGPLEGTNTKIRVMQRQAYGFRDKEFFKLKIYGLHETKIALVG